MQSEDGQKTQGARKMHTVEKKDLQQEDGRTIYISGISRRISLRSRCTS